MVGCSALVNLPPLVTQLAQSILQLAPRLAALGQRNRLLNQLLAQGVGLLRLPAQAVASGQQLGVYLLGHVSREPAAMLF